ncbi:MAG: Trm112 family protein [Desulfovibrionaceae bacterium]
MELQKELLNILACPRCHGALHGVEEAGSLIGLCCDTCQVVYPVRENIPVMLSEEAVSVDEWKQGKRTVA